MTTDRTGRPFDPDPYNARMKAAQAHSIYFTLRRGHLFCRFAECSRIRDRDGSGILGLGPPAVEVRPPRSRSTPGLGSVT